MQQNRPSRLIVGAAKTVFGVLLSLLLLLTSLLAASPVHDQSHPAHHGAGGLECALCLFSHGQVDLADPLPALAPRDLILTDGFAPVSCDFFAAPDYQLLPGRAPPAFS